MENMFLYVRGISQPFSICQHPSVCCPFLSRHATLSSWSGAQRNESKAVACETNCNQFGNYVTQEDSNQESVAKTLKQ